MVKPLGMLTLACVLLAGCQVFPSDKNRTPVDTNNDATSQVAEGPVATCRTAADCTANAIDTSFCANGRWDCVESLCQLACDISNKL
ncbi:MAG: hypothetical protein HY461_03140 [Parcubacteria group bacterium]|nr:hypothetical protein [Parcubacteria group bacterium]